jgi:hypothetical protein
MGILAVIGSTDLVRSGLKHSPDGGDIMIADGGMDGRQFLWLPGLVFPSRRGSRCCAGLRLGVSEESFNCVSQTLPMFLRNAVT